MSSLYRPTVFRMDQRATLLAHAAAYPFATVITYGEGGLAVSHLPLLIDPEREFLRTKLEAIAGFEIALESVEGKWKISQNRSLADQRRVIEWLEKGDEPSRALAAVMRARLDAGSS